MQMMEEKMENVKRISVTLILQPVQSYEVL